MLRLYRRHRTSCPNRSERVRNCKARCPIYVEGTLRGESVRKALDLTSWEAATDLIRSWEIAGEIGEVAPAIPTIAEAIEKFLADAKSRHLGWESLRKYEILLSRRLLPWCESEGYRLLKHLDVDRAREFRNSWDDGATYAGKNLERLRAFFRFCVDADWITKNPARAIKMPRSTQPPTLPFTPDEVARILDACDRYRGDKDRMRAFVLTMRYSGLRIGDTATLRRDRVKDGKVLLYQAKTGTPVFVPLPTVVTDALKKVENGSPYYFWNTGDGTVRTITTNWHRYLRSVFRLSNVDGAHSHRFRDTFAVELLLAGVSIDQVSVLLGHASVKVTEKHYAPWVMARQEQLEAAVRKTW